MRPYVSTDDGLTWNLSDNGFNDPEQILVWAIGAVGSTAIVYCTPNGNGPTLGIFESDDFGTSWHHALDTLFPSRGKVTSFTSVGNTLFAATDSLGVFLTTDNGTSWISENLGLGDSDVISLAVQGNELLAGTASSGVCRRPLAEMIPSASVASGKQSVDTISVSRPGIEYGYRLLP